MTKKISILPAAARPSRRSGDRRACVRYRRLSIEVLESRRLLTGITSVSPTSAAQGTTNLTVTINLASPGTPPVPPATNVPTSATIGTIQGTSLVHTSQYIVTGIFTIPSSQSVSTYDVGVSFSTPNGTVTYTLTAGFSVTTSTVPDIQVLDGAASVADGTGSDSFGSTYVGAAVSKTFTVTNTGNSNLTLTAPVSVPNGFTVISSFGSTTLAANASTTFIVRMDATTAGSYSGTLSFADNVSGKNPYDFTISGTVTSSPTADITVLDGATSIADGTGSDSFGTTVAGTPISKTFTVKNTGTANLTLTAPISVPSGFTVTSSFGSTTLAAGTSTTFIVQMSATTSGTGYNGTLSFADNVSGKSPYDFTISGSASGISSALLNSWFQSGQGEYTQVISAVSGGTTTGPSTTWSGQTTAVLGDVHKVQYATSSGYVYVSTSDLASYTMGPWWMDATKQQPFVNFPKDQNSIYRVAYNTTYPSTTHSTTANGAVGIAVNGVVFYNAGDANSYSHSTSADANPGDGIWNRLAEAVEATTFDEGNGHQPGNGQYHYHTDPPALRAQLSDNIDYVGSTDYFPYDPTAYYLTNGETSTDGLYVQDTADLHHSPIIGWMFDGYPVYGPYGYSDPTDPNSPVVRMTSSYSLRTDLTTGSARTSIPGWSADLDSATLGATAAATAATALYTMTTAQQALYAGPTVSSTYPLGRYGEDYAYVPGSGTLDQFNGRWCVTPEFPNGTYAYFDTIDANGQPAFPYIMNRQYYGATNGSGLVTTISEAVTTSFDVTTNKAPVASGPSSASAVLSRTLSFTGSNLISFSDVDAAATEKIALMVSSGTLSVTLSSSLAPYVSISAGANGSATLTLSGDVSLINTALTTLTYTAPTSGTSATLTTTPNDGSLSGTSVVTTLTLVNAYPVASAGGPYLIGLGSSLQLDASGSSAKNSSTIASYAWDFTLSGQYNSLITSSATANVAYSQLASLGTGVHTIGLRVTDSAGLTSTTTTTLEIRNGSITGTSSADPVRLALDSSDSTKADVFLSGSGSAAYSVVLSYISQWTVALGAGDDTLTVDFSNGNPLPSGGLAFDGGTHSLGDTLSITGSSQADSVVMTSTQVTFDTYAAITYSNVNYFSFNLGGGLDTLALNGGTLAIAQSNAISSSTVVTVDAGGVLNLGGYSDTLRGLTITNGQVSNGTINSSSYIVAQGSISANLTGSVSLTKSVSGTATLSGVNSYSGGTIVTSGTLIISSSTALRDGSALSVGTTVDQAFASAANVPDIAVALAIRDDSDASIESPATVVVSSASASSTASTDSVTVSNTLAAPISMLPISTVDVSSTSNALNLATLPASPWLIAPPALANPFVIATDASPTTIHDAAIRAATVWQFPRSPAWLEEPQSVWTFSSPSDEKTARILAMEAVMAAYNRN